MILQEIDGFEEIRVARPKKDTPKRNDIAVKIDQQVVRLARSIASFRDQSLAEYLSDLLRPIVSKQFDDLPKERKGAKLD